jgi:hypothetical protein
MRVTGTEITGALNMTITGIMTMTEMTVVTTTNISGSVKALSLRQKHLAKPVSEEAGFFLRRHEPLLARQPLMLTIQNWLLG